MHGVSLGFIIKLPIKLWTCRDGSFCLSEVIIYHGHGLVHWKVTLYRGAGYQWFICVIPLLQEIDELLGQNMTAEDEDAIAQELESIIAVSSSAINTVTCTCIYMTLCICQSTVLMSTEPLHAH